MKAIPLDLKIEGPPPPDCGIILESERRCKLDGLFLATHLACRRCELLIGKEHVAKKLLHGLCEYCQDDIARGAPELIQEDYSEW